LLRKPQVPLPAVKPAISSVLPAAMSGGCRVISLAAQHAAEKNKSDHFFSLQPQTGGAAGG